MNVHILGKYQCSIIEVQTLQVLIVYFMRDTVEITTYISLIVMTILCLQSKGSGHIFSSLFHAKTALVEQPRSHQGLTLAGVGMPFPLTAVSPSRYSSS